MTIYQRLREADFEASSRGPVIISDLSGIIEEFQASRSPVAILPGFLVPEAKPENYDLNTFKNNYVVFLHISD
jgi:hypothetical protein